MRFHLLLLNKRRTNLNTSFSLSILIFKICLKNSTIKKIDLTSKGLKNEDIFAIAKGKLLELETLNLSQNQFGDEGAISIGGDYLLEKS